MRRHHRLSKRLQRIFRRHPHLKVLQAGVLAAIGTASSACIDDGKTRDRDMPTAGVAAGGSPMTGGDASGGTTTLTGGTMEVTGGIAIMTTAGAPSGGATVITNRNPCDDIDCGTFEDTFDWTMCCEPGVGRPLTVEDEIRVATSISRSDWTIDRDGLVMPIDAAQRDILTNHWLNIAALEHASVASFSRFSLHLMALGAPPELLIETQEAIIDEIRHARYAYGMAAAYGNDAVGPAPLDLTGINLNETPENIVIALIREACIGETLGAAEANMSAELSAEKVVADLYREIAHDEAQHATLAWRSLKWLLDTHPELRDIAARTFREAIKGFSAPSDESKAGLEQFGVLAAQAKLDVYRDAIEAVVIPGAQALGMPVLYMA